MIDRHSPPLEQAVLADFIDGGHFARHIRQMRTLYAERQGAVVDSALAELSGAVDIPAAEAGMHLVARAVGASQKAIMAAASRSGVEYQPISRYSAAIPPASGLILGYAAYPPRGVPARDAGVGAGAQRDLNYSRNARGSAPSRTANWRNYHLNLPGTLLASFRKRFIW